MATKVYIAVRIEQRDLDWTPEERDNLVLEVEALGRAGTGIVHAAAAELAKAVEADFGVEVMSHYFDISD